MLRSYTEDPEQPPPPLHMVDGRLMPLPQLAERHKAKKETVEQEFRTSNWGGMPPVMHQGTWLTGLAGPRRYKNVYVRAQNAVGLGPPSNVIETLLLPRKLLA